MNAQLHQRLSTDLAERKLRGLERQLHTTWHIDDAFVNLADNDYLGLAGDPRLKAAAQAAVEQWGCSASASPLITGYQSVHQDLEAVLCDWFDFPYGLIWTTGYAANSSVLSMLPRRGDLVLADRLIHNSMITGILRSKARLIRYRHCDLNHLESLLQRHARNDRLIFVVTETVFSMDGDYPDLVQMAVLKERYGFVWIVDEAHALGWYGPRGNGLLAEAKATEAADVIVGTMGKSMGSMGSFTLFRKEAVRRYLLNYAGEFIYSTYLAPPCAAAALKAIHIIQNMTPQRLQWHKRSKAFRRSLQRLGVEVPNGDSPIIPIILGDVERTREMARFLHKTGILVAAICPPTVPEGLSRLRLSLKTSFNEDIQGRILNEFKSGLVDC